MPTVHDILLSKGSEVAAIELWRSARDAAQIMNAKRIGSLVVVDGREVIGIVTERDVLIRVVAEGRDPDNTPVRAVMTSPVVCCCPETSLSDCKAIISSRRLRHIPVVADGVLVGIVTSGDIMAREAFEREDTLVSLCEYIGGPAAHC